MSNFDIPTIRLQWYKDKVEITDETTWRHTFSLKKKDVVKRIECMNTSIYIHIKGTRSNSKYKSTISCASASSNYIEICSKENQQTCSLKKHACRIETPYHYHIDYSDHAVHVNDLRGVYLYFLP